MAADDFIKILKEIKFREFCNLINIIKKKIKKDIKAAESFNNKFLTDN